MFQLGSWLEYQTLLEGQQLITLEIVFLYILHHGESIMPLFNMTIFFMWIILDTFDI